MHISNQILGCWDCQSFKDIWLIRRIDWIDAIKLLQNSSYQSNQAHMIMFPPESHTINTIESELSSSHLMGPPDIPTGRVFESRACPDWFPSQEGGLVVTWNHYMILKPSLGEAEECDMRMTRVLGWSNIAILDSNKAIILKVAGAERVSNRGVVELLLDRLEGHRVNAEVVCIDDKNQHEFHCRCIHLTKWYRIDSLLPDRLEKYTQACWQMNQCYSWHVGELVRPAMECSLSYIYGEQRDNNTIRCFMLK